MGTEGNYEKINVRKWGKKCKKLFPLFLQAKKWINICLKSIKQQQLTGN